MNRKKSYQVRKKRSLSVFEVGFYILAALVIIAGGVNYAILKNEQVALDREIDKVYQSVKRHDMDTNSVMVEVARKINRFAIRSELREQNSVMRERPDFVVERVNLVNPPLVSTTETQKSFEELLRPIPQE